LVRSASSEAEERAILHIPKDRAIMPHGFEYGRMWVISYNRRLLQQRLAELRLRDAEDTGAVTIEDDLDMNHVRYCVRTSGYSLLNLDLPDWGEVRFFASLAGVLLVCRLISISLLPIGFFQSMAVYGFSVSAITAGIICFKEVARPVLTSFFPALYNPLPGG
jgi:hypothetical protein